MLFLLVCSIVGRAATGDVYKLVTSDSELKSGDVVVIASGTKAMGEISSNGRTITPKDITITNDTIYWFEGLKDAILEKTGSNWFVKFDGQYIHSRIGSTDLGFSSSTSGDRWKYNISVSADGSADINNEYRRISPYINYTNSGFVFGNNKSNLKIYKKYLSNGIKLLAESVSVTLNNTHTLPISNPKGMPLTYNSSNPGVASVDADGNVSLKAWGKTTITVTYAGNSTYQSFDESYELTVTDNKKNIDCRTVTFVAGTEKGTNEDYSGFDAMTKDVVKVSSDNAAFKLLPYEILANNTLDIKVDKGRIVMVEIEGSNPLNGMTLVDDSGTYNVVSSFWHVWNGSSKTVSIKAVGNNASIKSIWVYVEYPNALDYTFDESKENTIEAWDNVNVTLNRTLVANKWNTLCLPFDVEGDNLVELLGEGAKVTEYSSTDDEGTLKFTKVDKMVAGKPYLVKPTKGGDAYTFKGVEVKSTEPTPVDHGVTFKGLFSPKDITEDGRAAGVTGTGAIKFATGGSKTKAFRAYFVVPEATSTAALCLSIDGTVTAISDIVADTEDDANAPVYNLQGQRVDARSLTKGVYIKNGRKFVVNK